MVEPILMLICLYLIIAHPSGVALSFDVHTLPVFNWRAKLAVWDQ